MPENHQQDLKGGWGGGDYYLVHCFLITFKRKIS